MSDRIAEIENRLNAATPGPWATNGMDAGHSKYEMNIWVESENGDFICDMDGLTRSDNEKANDDGSADSNFIAHSPSDVAYLLAELRKRDEALARVHLACDAMDAGVAIRSGDSRTKHVGATTIRAVIREALGGGV